MFLKNFESSTYFSISRTQLVVSFVFGCADHLLFSVHDPKAHMYIIYLFQIYSAKRDGVHKEFQKAIEAAVCRYIPDKGILSVMVLTKSCILA